MLKNLPGQSDDQIIRNFFKKKVMMLALCKKQSVESFILTFSAKKLRKKLKQEEAARVKLFNPIIDE